MTLIALWAVAMLIGVSSGAASAASFTSAELFPFQGDNSWSFESSDFDLGTLTLLPGFEFVNGVPTRVIHSTGPVILGADEFFTNDQSGLRLHGAGIEIFGCAGRIELSPPIVLMPAAVSTGQATPRRALETSRPPVRAKHRSVPSWTSRPSRRWSASSRSR